MTAVPENASARARLVVLVSGSGSNLQALLDAATDPRFPADVVAVGADVPDAYGLTRASDVDVPTFVLEPPMYADRAAWTDALADAVASYEPDWVVCAGFMRILGAAFVQRFAGRIVNTHPALLPSFPGAHGVRDAMAYGVKVTGCTVHLVDEGVDTGPILAQAPVAVRADDDEASLHERIKTVERELLVETVAALAAHGCTVTGRKVTIP
ncbi:MAG: phosphoribosylglycinamide formyltransferase [Candidatus Nanopelagicales bacterium]